MLFSHNIYKNLQIIEIIFVPNYKKKNSTSAELFSNTKFDTIVWGRPHACILIGNLEHLQKITHKYTVLSGLVGVPGEWINHVSGA
jgi:hypothetical protein